MSRSRAWSSCRTGPRFLSRDASSLRAWSHWQHDLEPKCPFDRCSTTITDVELAQLLTETEMQSYYDTSIDVAAVQNPGIFKCLTSKCRGATALSASDPRFTCPLCRAERCVRCNTRTWHNGLTCEQFKKSKPDSQLHPEQLQLLFANRSVYQCGSCGFGPTEHARCSNLRTHQNEAVGQRGRIKNNCPRCGWFADNISEWPQWDGRSHKTKENLVKRKLVGLKRWFVRCGFDLDFAIAARDDGQRPS